MRNVVKPIVFGSLLAIGLGITGYFVVILYHTLILGVDDSKLLVDIIHSKRMVYYSMPYTLVVLVLSTTLVTRKIQSNHIFISMVIILITTVSVTLGPLKIISIHTNYLPIIFGGLIGAYLGKKLNRGYSRQAAECDIGV
jgi:hypothetical protein